MENNLKDLIQLIEQKSSITNIVSDYITLEKKGNNSVGLCPFHSDSNPSMSVSDSKGIFKCFSCGAGGGAINFIQNFEGISFIDAVKKISEKLDIDWTKYLSQKEIKIDPIEVRGWEINSEAQIFFSYNLKNTDNQSILEYIKKRDLNKDVISKFKIGFSSEKNSLILFLIKKGFSEEEIINYGLAKRNKDSKIVDYFINRLIFPIENSSGKIIGFSGRIIDNSKYAKYMNSPETSIFKKSNILYNLFNAKTSANLKKELIIVEGFMDVIALYKSGIENSIATMGTAFTKQHSQLVKSITNNITIAFDSDTPGINATIITGKELIKNKLNVNAISIPLGKDFDELYKIGKEEVIKIILKKNSFLDYYKEKIYQKLDNDKGTVDSKILKELLKTVLLYDDQIQTDIIMNEISKKYGVEISTLKNEISNNFIEHEQNYKIPPYLSEFVPEEEFSKTKINNINNQEAIKPMQIKLMFMEELIISYAINFPEGFEFLTKNPIIFVRESMHNLWLSYKYSKENNTVIDNQEMIFRIKKITNEDYISKMNKDIIEISNIEDYKLFIDNYNAMAKTNNRNTFLEKIKNSNDEEEIIFLTSLLKN